MASKKLDKAIVEGVVKVRNNITGEIKLTLEGKHYYIPGGATFDVTAKLNKASDARNVPGLSDLLKQKRLVLL